MYVLGLNIGHNATACLLRDGAVVACVSEERFSRIKNHAGIPYQSINYLMSEEKISLGDIDYIVTDSHYDIEKDPYFGKRVLENYKNKPFRRKMMSRFLYRFPRIHAFVAQARNKTLSQESLEEKKNNIAHALSVPPTKIILTDHHLMHALATSFNLNPKEKTLVFTLDGEGSGVCASVNVYDGKRMHVLKRSKVRASLGYLYGNITMCLGMKPLEHEFKVMGLAPYAKADKVQKLYDEKVKDIVRVTDDLEFVSKFHMVHSDEWFFDLLKFERFDVIAGSIQKLTEERVKEWVGKAIAKTGIRSIALSGGVFMNVKVNQLLAEMPEVEKMFVMPSAGDESNAIGACFYGYRLYCEKNNIAFKPKPITHLYLGPEYDENYIKSFIEKENLNQRYTIKKVKKINHEIAKLLAKGEIVARCSGKSEWGARALGNRSILANPAHPDTIRVLNEAIKDRDFWMPFTPSMLDSYAKKYIVNPKNITAPYMVVTFHSTAKAQKDLPAAMHPYDFTVRPQIVTKAYNPDYYEVIKEFSKLTGAGAVLNTSFNLHGEPNVLTPEDALHTVENSALKYLVLENYLLEKR